MNRFFATHKHSWNFEYESTILQRNYSWFTVTLIYKYSNPSIYVASIKVVSIYVAKFFVPSNFNLRRDSIYVACFWNQLRRKSRDYCKFV